MTLRNFVAIAAVSFATSLAFTPSAAAQSRDAFDAAFDRINPEVLFKGLIREDDVSLLFQHLRESICEHIPTFTFPNKIPSPCLVNCFAR